MLDHERTLWCLIRDRWTRSDSAHSSFPTSVHDIEEVGMFDELRLLSRDDASIKREIEATLWRRSTAMPMAESPWLNVMIPVRAR